MHIKKNNLPVGGAIALAFANLLITGVASKRHAYQLRFGSSRFAKAKLKADATKAA